MLRDGIDAYLREDAGLARAIKPRDEVLRTNSTRMPAERSPSAWHKTRRSFAVT